MRRRWASTIAILALMAATAAPPQVHAAAAPQDGIMSNLPWNQPPAEFKEMQRKGFHDGVQAAIKDYDKHRDPDLERHKGFVHPKVDKSYVPDYRDGYKRGYNDAYRHMLKTHGQAS